MSYGVAYPATGNNRGRVMNYAAIANDRLFDGPAPDYAAFNGGYYVAVEAGVNGAAVSRIRVTRCAVNGAGTTTGVANVLRFMTYVGGVTGFLFDVALAKAKTLAQSASAASVSAELVLPGLALPPLALLLYGRLSWIPDSSEMIHVNADYIQL